MFKIELIVMPFGSMNSPSLALTLLKAVIDREFGSRVVTEIRYLTLDFAELLGLSAYREMGIDPGGAEEQAGEWFFRHVAFPDAPDNTEEYLARFLPGNDMHARTVKEAIREHRPKLDSYLDIVIRRHKLYEADLVGLTTLVFQRVANIALLRKLKQLKPNLITVMGGPSCDYPAAPTLVENVPWIDFAFSGPSLVTFRQFIGHCLEKRTDACHRIPGVFSRSSLALRGCVDKACPEGEGPARPLVERGEDYDLELYPELDYREFLRRFVAFCTATRRDSMAFLPFVTSEGCWWNRCMWCSHNYCNGVFRSMSPEKALGQFEQLFRHGSPHMLVSSDNIMPPTYIKKVFAHLRTPQGMNILYDVRTNQLTDDDFEILSRARVNILLAGVEGFSNALLESMCKGTVAFDNIMFLKRLRSYDMGAWWQLLMGMPGDTKGIRKVYEKCVRDYPSFRHLPPPHLQLPVLFMRGSRLWRDPAKYHLDLQPPGSYQAIYPFSKDAIRNLTLYFKDCTENPDYAVARDQYWGPVAEQVRLWRLRWIRHLQGVHAELRHKDADVPLLVFVPKGEGVVVYDSRPNPPVERPLSSLQARLLESLSSPKRVSDLVEELGLPAEVDLQKEMETLVQWGLVFEEEGSYLSLVIGSHTRWDTMTPRELVFSLQALDLQLWAEDGRLKYKAAPGVLTEALRRELSQRRDAIAARLRESEDLSRDVIRGAKAWMGTMIEQLREL